MQLDDFGVPQLKVVLCFINLFLILAVLAVVWRSNDGLASPKWCSERRSVVAGHGQDVLRWVRPVAFGRGQSLTQKKNTDISASSKDHPKTIQLEAIPPRWVQASEPRQYLRLCWRPVVLGGMEPRVWWYRLARTQITGFTMIDLGRPGIWGWGTSQSWLVHGVSTLEHFRTTDGKKTGLLPVPWGSMR